ncbi:MAG: hypothetical protein SVV03_05865 [Candidatus Nanohaloarchaea archaeon]|nr:hypothetical protein [Candidatus Nanohaloarchaea archaeon]
MSIAPIHGRSALPVAEVIPIDVKNGIHSALIPQAITPWAKNVVNTANLNR